MNDKTIERKIEGYPRAMGNEQETGLIFKLKDLDKWLELDEFNNDFFDTCVNDDDEAHSQQFLVNGMRVYAGGALGASSSTNLERATPECLRPRQLTAYVAGADLYLEKLIERYVPYHNQTLTPNSEYTEITDVRSHRRVRDYEGNTKACHDSFDAEFLKKNRSIEIAKVLILTHSVTRPIVTGAGYVDDDHAFYYGQKMSNIDEIDNKAYESNIYFDCERLGRLELRSGDQCVSEWATWMRVGSAALVLALSDTPAGVDIADKLNEYLNKYFVDIRREAKRLNLHNSPEANTESADIQEMLATYALDKLQLYRDLPLEYFDIANEWYKYIEDYKKALSGHVDFSILSDRSDWSSKYVGIMNKINNSNGENRYLGDFKSLMHDQTFDMTKYQFVDGVLSKIKGWGFINYDKNGKKILKPNEATSALKIPPNTRAKIRSDLIRAYGEYLDDVDWDRIIFEELDGKGNLNIDLSTDPSLPVISKNGLYAIERLKTFGIIPKKIK